jgi:hypothetical protein
MVGFIYFSSIDQAIDFSSSSSSFCERVRDEKEEGGRMETSR